MSIDRKTEHDKKDYQLIDMHPTEMPLPYNKVDIDGVHTHTHIKILKSISVIYIIEGTNM